MSSKTATLPSASKSPIGGQFKATKLWKDLVGHLYENANVKKRRVLMKSHDDCFSGGNAVDTLLSYVQENADRFPNTTMVTRENISRLCQSFLDADVFECVNAGDDSERKTKFEDSSTRLYRFDLQNKKEFMKNSGMYKSMLSLNMDSGNSIANEVDRLPSKFSTLLSVPPHSVEPVTRHKTIFSRSPFMGHSRKKSISCERRTGTVNSSQTSDSDCENNPPVTRRTPKLKRTGSIAGIVMKRSSSDSNLRKQSSTGTSSDSDTASKRRSPGDPLTRGRLRLSQRLSFRKKSLRRSGHSSYHLQQPCVIQNPAVDHDDMQAMAQKDTKRKCQKNIIPDDNNTKVQIMSSKSKQRKLTQQETSHVKRESVRVRLLQILDVPFVETLVISPTFDKKGNSGSSQIENHHINRYSGMHYSEVASSYNNDDPWIFNSLTVLQHVPDSYNILRKHARLPDQQKKTELYFAIADYYGSMQRPLIDENYNGIAQAIISLLATRPVDKMMEATQLFVHLIPDAKLAELRHLCMYLHTVCTLPDPKLVHKGNNQALVIQTFTPAVLRMPDSMSSEIGINGCRGLVRFMVQHHLRVFMLPASTEMVVQRKIELLEQGEIESPSLVPDSTYCSLISESEYQNQRVTCTHKQVRELYSQIQTSTSLTARKKKDLVKKLQKQHPDAFGVNNNESDKIYNERESERTLVQQTQSFLNLSRVKTQRKHATRDLPLRGESSANVRRNKPLRDSALPARMTQLTAPNSDPLTRKRRNTAQTEIFI